MQIKGGVTVGIAEEKEMKRIVKKDSVWRGLQIKKQRDFSVT